MTHQAFLVYPHQLFELLLERPTATLFYLLEEPLYFTQYAFHKQKLLLHRASMKYFKSRLEKKGFTVHYLETHSLSDESFLTQLLQKHAVSVVHYYATTDDWLEQKTKRILKPFTVNKHKSPMFLSDKNLFDQHFKKAHPSMASFYMEQRKKLNLLVQDKKPVGGKWSLDEENRKKLPKGHVPPMLYCPKVNTWQQEAATYVDNHFSSHPGNTNSFQYACTHEDAQACLHDFLKQRFTLFGPYEDAISTTHDTVYHSVLSPYLNIGLLTPQQVISETLSYASSHPVPLNSLEGFIRQIIGWREYMLGLYVYKGRKERTANFWNHKRKLPAAFWTGDTGIAPVDAVIKKVLNRAYSHHIERLMVMGNFMLLCEIDPDDVYRWFMELYIDAYDWVMVPNVYSMSQYASGGSATTKPYLSGSNYILKMSDHKKGDWCEIWDALYWRFIDTYKSFFQENPRLSAMTYHLNNMSKEKLKNHHAIAEQFLCALDEQS